MIHPDTFKKVEFSGTKGLVFLKDKIVVYRRDSKTINSPGLIDLPGGGREENESPFDTFIREVMEEFGIRVTEKEIISSFRQNSHVNPGTKSFFFVTKSLDLGAEDIVFGDEGTEWFLMTPEDFLSRADGIERQQKRVEKYLSGKMMSE